MAAKLSTQLLIGLLFFGAGVVMSRFLVSDTSSVDAPESATSQPKGDAEGDEFGMPGLPDYKARTGRFRPLPQRGSVDDANVEGSNGIERLGDLGYASGYEPSPDDAGVVFHASDFTDDGLNLYHDGSGPMARVIDMDGNVLHSWHFELSRLLDDEEIHAIAETMARIPDKSGYWRRVHAYPNGDLLAIFADAALIKLDKDSNLLWAWRGAPHHDLWVDEDNGEIFVLTRKIKVMPRFSAARESAEDFVTVLSSDGRLLREYSIMDAVLKSNFSSLQHLSPRGGDLQHTNTIEVLDGRLSEKSTAFKKGNFLLSLCRIDTILIMDPSAGLVVWSMAGPWHRQHQPTVLENGNMLLFDNRGFGGKSKVIEFDPFSQEIAWDYRHSKELPFSSLSCGSNQRLSNGNTLIVETDSGRAFEVDRSRKIVWEFFTPNRAGDDGELIATLFDVIRLPRDYFGAWLEE